MGGRNSGGGGRPGIKRSMMARQSSLGDEDGLDLEVEAEAEAEAAASKGSSDSGIGDFEDATACEDSGESTGSTLQGEEYVRLLKSTVIVGFSVEAVQTGHTGPPGMTT